MRVIQDGGVAQIRSLSSNGVGPSFSFSLPSIRQYIDKIILIKVTNKIIIEIHLEIETKL